MKTLIVVIAILSSSLINNSYGKGILNMNKKLKKAITFKEGVLPVKKDATQFVKISFKINSVGRIEILEMNYSDEEVKNQLINKLSEIKVEEEYNVNEVYNYNFTFKIM